MVSVGDRQSWLLWLQCQSCQTQLTAQQRYVVLLSVVDQDNLPLLSMEWLGSNVEVAVVVAVCVVVCVGAAAGIRRQGRERSERWFGATVGIRRQVRERSERWFGATVGIRRQVRERSERWFGASVGIRRQGRERSERFRLTLSRVHVRACAYRRER